MTVALVLYGSHGTSINPVDVLVIAALVEGFEVLLVALFGLLAAKDLLEFIGGPVGELVMAHGEVVVARVVLLNHLSFSAKKPKR